jgi:hypothetical protein
MTLGARLAQLCRDRAYPFVRLDGTTTIKKRNKLVRPGGMQRTLACVASCRSSVVMRRKAMSLTGAQAGLGLRQGPTVLGVL